MNDIFLRWILGIVASVLVAGIFGIIGYGAQQFGKWSDTLADLTKTVDTRADSMQVQIGMIAVEQAKNLTDVKLGVERINGRLDVIDAAGVYRDVGALRHEQMSAHPGATMELDKLKSRVQRIEDARSRPE